MGSDKVESLNELQKVDMLRERTGSSYADAKQLLEAAGGDLVEALILHEEGEAKRDPQARFLAAVQRLIHQGNITRLRVQKGNRTYLEIPVTAGVIGVAVAPQLALMAGLVCLIGRCTVGFQRSGDSEGGAWHTFTYDDPTP